MPKEQRIAVGSPDGLRSSVWKFWIHGKEIYIQSRMFGRDSKVSLHSSGSCQWSLTDVWVKKEEGRKNSDRHMVKWNAPRPTGSEAQHIFRVHILETELREIPDVEKLKKVRFIEPPSSGYAISLECYITPPSPNDPALQGNLPYPVEVSLPMEDGSWFIVMRNSTCPCATDIEEARKSILSEIGNKYTPEAKHRIAAFTELPGVTRGLIELCATKP